MKYITGVDWAREQDRTSEITVSSCGRVLRMIGVAARRHKCEKCKNVFECHLCSFESCHILHAVVSSANRPVFVCKPCIEATGMYQVRVYSWRKQTFCFYDHVSGKVID